MTRTILIALGMLAVSASAFAQTNDEIIERALAAAPRQAKEGATVIKWNADQTYETLKKGTNRLVCYDQSGQPGEQPFSVQCTTVGNLDRVAQNRKFEVEQDKAKRAALFEAAEKDGTRVKPEYGAPWLSMSGADRATARMHTTIAVPGATTQSTGPARQQQDGRRVDHERGHDDRAHHDSGLLG